MSYAAYCSGEKLQDLQTGKQYDYTHKEDVLYNEILLPDHAPAHLQDRQTLWNTVEQREPLPNSQLAREIEAALPRELQTEQHIEIVRNFATNELISRGMIADISIHMPHARDGLPQPHTHILTTMREITEDGFGNKVREWNLKPVLYEMRESWAEHVNDALEKANVPARIDHRTLEAQGIDREPEPKIGAAAQAMESRGIETERGNLWRDVMERNAGSREVENTRTVQSGNLNLEASNEEPVAEQEDEDEHGRRMRSSQRRNIIRRAVHTMGYATIDTIVQAQGTESPLEVTTLPQEPALIAETSGAEAVALPVEPVIEPPVPDAAELATEGATSAVDVIFGLLIGD